MTMMTRVENFGKLLKIFYNNTKIPIYHYMGSKEKNRYIVWQEKSYEGFSTDDESEEGVWTGVIYLLTKIEYDEAVEELYRFLIENDTSCRYISTDYDKNTNYITHEWEVIF